MGEGVYWLPDARFLTSQSRVLERASGENGVRKLTTCADPRGPAFEGRPARTSRDFGPTRQSAISGGIVGEPGNRNFGISPGRHVGGVYWIPAARFLTSPSRVLQEIPVENEVRQLTTCADRRGPAFESRPARKPPDFGPARKSASSGDTARGIWKSGSRDLDRTSWGGFSDGAFSEVSVARFRVGFKRQRGPEADYLRRPAGARI